MLPRKAAKLQCLPIFLDAVLVQWCDL